MEDCSHVRLFLLFTPRMRRRDGNFIKGKWKKKEDMRGKRQDESTTLTEKKKKIEMKQYDDEE